MSNQRGKYDTPEPRKGDPRNLDSWSFENSDHQVDLSEQGSRPGTWAGNFVFENTPGMDEPAKGEDGRPVQHESRFDAERSVFYKAGEKATFYNQSEKPDQPNPEPVRKREDRDPWKDIIFENTPGMDK